MEWVHPISHNTNRVYVLKAVGTYLFSVPENAVGGTKTFRDWFFSQRSLSKANLEGIQVIICKKWVSVKAISGGFLSLILVQL